MKEKVIRTRRTKAIHYLAHSARLRKYCSDLIEFSKNGKREIRTFKIHKNRRGFRIISEPIGEYKVVLQKANKLFQFIFSSLMPHPKTPLKSPFIFVNSTVNSHLFSSKNSKVLYIKADLKNAFNHVTRGMLVSELITQKSGLYITPILLQCIDLFFHPKKEGLLPQGFPTSPAIFNICAAKIDRAIEASAFIMSRTILSGPNMDQEVWNYYRYLDDLIFTLQTPNRRKPDIAKFTPYIEQLVKGTGFRINRSKTRFMTAGTVPESWKGLIEPRVNILGLLADNMSEILRTSKKEANLLRGLLHVWNSHPEKRTSELKAKISGHLGWITSVTPKGGSLPRSIIKEFAEFSNDSSYKI